MTREYKDSGIAWIGQIPKDWKVISFNNGIQRMSTGLNPRDNFELTKDDEYYYVTIKNFKDGKVYLDDNCDRISKKAWDIIQERSQLQKGDILFASISKDGQAYILEAHPVNWNINESVFSIRTNHEYFYDKYFYYHIIDSEYYNDLRLDATGTTFQSIKQNKLRKSMLCLPPLSEQQKIASYLDKVCGEVDEMVKIQEQMIEELKAYKQSIITEAVTKGLNPNVPMKDSGIDWIGDVPEEWKTIRIKHLLKERKEKSETGDEEPLSMSQKCGIIPTKNMDMIPNMASSFIGAKVVYISDLVFNKLKAHLGVFSVSKYNGLVSPDYAVYYSTGRADLKFLEYLFKTPQCIGEFRKRSTGVGAGLMRLYTDDLYSILIPFPPLDEQQSIASYLDTKCAEIDALIAIKQTKIDELKEYKKSVIYEYVTGKKEVV